MESCDLEGVISDKNTVNKANLFKERKILKGFCVVIAVTISWL